MILKLLDFIYTSGNNLTIDSDTTLALNNILDFQIGTVTNNGTINHLGFLDRLVDPKSKVGGNIIPPPDVPTDLATLSLLQMILLL